MRIDISHTDITTALGVLARTMKVSIGWRGQAPSFKVRPLHGKWTPEDALRVLLRGSPYVARRVSGTAYLIEPVTRTRPPHVSAPSVKIENRHATQDHPPVAAETPIVVTAQKRPQDPFYTAVAIALAKPKDILPGRIITATSDVATAIDGLAVTNLGTGRNRQFIRGVADSPFNGTSQSTVAVVFNDARLTFDAPDPDLRLVDVDRVEVLKGPQGPLYGSGALGGIYRIVTRAPELDRGSVTAGGFAEAMAGGAPGGGAEATINLPVITDHLALRAVGYLSREGGWVDNISRNHDANATLVQGGRLALRWEPEPGWRLDLIGAAQDINAADSQYVDAPGDERDRSSNVAEPTDNDVRIVSATLQGPVGDLQLTVTSSYVAQDLFYRLESTPVSAMFGLDGPSVFDDRREYRVINNEVRLSPANGAWVVGLAQLSTRSSNLATIRDSIRTSVAERRYREVAEYAGFAEGRIDLTSYLQATIGGRVSLTTGKDEAGDQTANGARRSRATNVSPTIALSWQTGPRGFAFARYASATRPGGLTLRNQGVQEDFAGDDLGTFDLGYRWRNASDTLQVELGAFFTDWRNIQSDYLLPNGLVSTRNAGDARISGLELSADLKASASLRLSAGFTYTDAMLVRTSQDVKLDNRRLPVTPVTTARGVARYGFAWRRWTGEAFIQANYVGPARLAFDTGLDRRMGGYVRAATGISFTRSGLGFGLRADNVLDSHGDSFAFGNPFSINAGRQRTPARPRSVMVSFSITR